MHHTSDLRIPFASHEHATIAKQVIEVDAELQPQAVKRALKVEDSVLIAYVCDGYRRDGNLIVSVRTFTTLTIRLARLTVNGFLENVDLVLRTLAEFGEEAEQRPS